MLGSAMEKPLHVLVAEALGWSYIGPGNSMNIADPGIGYPPLTPIVGHKEPIPHYDTDWAATGPLIERFKMDVWYRPGGVFGDAEWAAVSDHEADTGMQAGATPLLAACNLILALHTAGVLHSGTRVNRPPAAVTD